MLRVRFAPSPTGYLHIGSARTFIFNWLYARRHNGTMILRLDDTDRDRNTQASVDSIIEGLTWLELSWDEFYRQSDRVELHRKAAASLLERGLAYRDFTPTAPTGDEQNQASGPWRCNMEMRELSREASDFRANAGEPYVVRFRVPRGLGRQVNFRDEVYGEQSVDCDDMEDFALLRSTGIPTYHLASCTDDADLKISHIIRGQDHLTNTFKHILLFESLGARIPKFAHLPLLIASDGSKLSKRKHGPAVSVTTYRDAGFLPHAFVNFLCLLGWSPKDNREQMTRGEIVEAFGFEGINRSNAMVNFTGDDPLDQKAMWINTQHLRQASVTEILPYVRKALLEAGVAPQEDASRFASVVDVIRSRLLTLNDFPTRGRAYFTDEFEMDPEAENRLNEPGAREMLRELADRLANEVEFTESTIEMHLRDLAAERNVNAGALMSGSRAALTGQPVGPGAFDVFTALGRDRAIARLRSA